MLISEITIANRAPQQAQYKVRFVTSGIFSQVFVVEYQSRHIAFVTACFFA